MEQRKENRGSKNEKRINPREPLRLSVFAVKTTGTEEQLNKEQMNRGRKIEDRKMKNE